MEKLRRKPKSEEPGRPEEVDELTYAPEREREPVSGVAYRLTSL
jgi:hypothetical protein